MDGADGHATRDRGQLLLVTAADCIPVYLVARLNGRLRWFTRGGVARRGTSSLRRCRSNSCVVTLASRAGDIVMHCGVGICGRCYEVGPEVAIGAVASGPLSAPAASGSTCAAMLRRAGSGARSRRDDQPVAIAPPTSLPTSFRIAGRGGADGRMVAYLGLPLV